MPRAQIEIDIPDDCEIVKGPVFSSALWNDDIRKRPHTGVICFHVVVQRKWEWPSWLNAAAVVKTSVGSWMACQLVPHVDEQRNIWIHTGRSFTIDETILDFTPPPCSDWRQSLRLNPNREANP